MEKSTQKHLPIVAFLIILLTLFAIDYQKETSGEDSFFLGSIIQLFKPGTITDDLLEKTSLKSSEIISLGSTPSLFDPYLQFPENIKARRYTVENTTIFISEVQAQASRLTPFLLGQSSPEYQFNKINSETFYLNQTPPEKKTHNFLGIVIDQILYGFQYTPSEHQKVLEIIDALQQNE